MKSQTLLLVCLLALAGSVWAGPARSERDNLCNSVAPGSRYTNYQVDECTANCLLAYVFMFQAHLDCGTPCKDGKGRCMLGQCRPLDYEMPPATWLHTYKIRIKEAHVTNADEFTGKSDAFVTVKLLDGSSTSFPDDTHLCATPVIDNNLNPKWDFTCRPVVLKPSARLMFRVYDKEEIGNNELLGEVTATISDLARSGSTELKLGNSYHGHSGQALTVEVAKSVEQYYGC